MVFLIKYNLFFSDYSVKFYSLFMNIDLIVIGLNLIRVMLNFYSFYKRKLNFMKYDSY